MSGRGFGKLACTPGCCGGCLRNHVDLVFLFSFVFSFCRRLCFVQQLFAVGDVTRIQQQSNTGSKRPPPTGRSKLGLVRVFWATSVPAVNSHRHAQRCGDEWLHAPWAGTQSLSVATRQLQTVFAACVSNCKLSRRTPLLPGRPRKARVVFHT